MKPDRSQALPFENMPQDNQASALYVLGQLSRTPRWMVIRRRYLHRELSALLHD